MLYYVEINWPRGFGGQWVRLEVAYMNRDDAEWDIAKWRAMNGSNGKDTGFRVVETLPSG